MGVDGSIPGSSSEIFSFSVGNVFAVSLNVSLGQSEVKKENFVASFVVAHAEIIRFDVSVDEVPVMNVLNSGDHLIHQHEDSLQGKLSESIFEKWLKGGAHQIHHQDVVVSWISLFLP